MTAAVEKSAMLRKSRRNGLRKLAETQPRSRMASVPLLVAAMVSAAAAWASDLTSAAPVDADAERGRSMLVRYRCGSCHTIPGVAAARSTYAVSLAAYGRRSYVAGRIANDSTSLVRWIMAPASVVPGTLMPAMGVSAADARDMAAYLGQLR